jgi:3-hydroxyacyl-[acyl-carrier-protein] dehydratase
MLLNDFYTIENENQDENAFSATIRFNASHAIFNGHFPGQPVVPGVCMIQIVKELLEECLERKILLTQAPQVKFLQLITPETTPVLLMSWTREENYIALTAGFKTEKDLFKMSARFY